MAKAVLIINRRGFSSLPTRDQLDILRRRLLPDHLRPRPTLVRQERGVTAVLLNPNGASRLSGTSIWLGAAGQELDWERVGGPVPEGSFALLRSDDTTAELIADAGASRSVWYCHTRDRFIASTSQRAIVALLGDFQPEPDVVPWMLSSGTLGPQGGWDRRLRLLEPGQSLRLDRANWKLAAESRPFEFRPDQRTSDAIHLAHLGAAVVDACCRMRLDPGRWIVPLSGGVDSRGLLHCLSVSGARWRTVTWGADSALKLTDQEVAAQVASRLGSEHRFWQLQLPSDSRETLVRRFLVAGEGRVAAMSGYADGFAIWNALHEDGLDGVVRGDEAFGSLRPASSFEARRSARLLLCADYFPAGELERLELPRQEIPDSLKRRNSETLAAWSDRLYQQFRLPRFCAALTDLKTSYVEVANPFLAAEVLDLVRRLPDRLRADKRLWRRWVSAVLPGVPFALHPAIPPLQDLLSDTGMLELIADELARDCPLLGPGLRRELQATAWRLLSAAPEQRERADIRRRFSFLPRRLTALLRPAVRRNRRIDPIVLAFHALIVSRMTLLLAEDAESLSPRLQQTAVL